MEADTLLEVEDLQVHFETREGLVRAVNGAGFKVRKGETLGIVGESGCGKSVTARAILGLVPKAGRVVSGSIWYRYPNGDEVDITTLSQTGSQIRQIRGKEIGMVFQEPMSSFSAVHTIGNQIMEAILLHELVGRKEARERAIEALGQAGIPSPGSRVDAYPFELSGGMRQRAMIATALACRPSLLIADEPTTALDVTIQAQILELLQRLQDEMDMSIIMITHNLGVVAAMAHRVAVMYLGRVVEEAPTGDIFASSKHPYTKGLLDSVPLVTGPRREDLYTIQGNVPDPYSEVSGCPFHPRCPRFVSGVCDSHTPPSVRVADEHSVRCVLYEETSLNEEAVESS